MVFFFGIAIKKSYNSRICKTIAKITKAFLESPKALRRLGDILPSCIFSTV